ncbi:MAG TPA: hypothetical protein VNO21_11315 [Polyangiaceae bacterium]|nr:hypothetical protein [Polyangiaceae bacterium]
MLEMIERTRRLTGVSLPEGRFRVHETHASVDIDAVFEVLRGNLAAYRIRGFVPPEACRRIVDNFWASPARVPRLGQGEDGVEGYFIGASHIEKTTREYLEEARAFEEAIEKLYAATGSPVSAFRRALVSGSAAPVASRLRQSRRPPVASRLWQSRRPPVESRLRQSRRPPVASRLWQSRRPPVDVRPARFEGLSAGDSKAVYWNNPGHFLLQPHDDLAQLRDPMQKGFEIQRATRVMAVNVYAQVPANSGQLQVWNIEPDDRSRSELNLTYSGFPYPPHVLEGYQSTIIPVETGDLLLLYGNLVHAVLRGATTSLKNRLLLTCFMTRTSDRELLWWT